MKLLLEGNLEDKTTVVEYRYVAKLIEIWQKIEDVVEIGKVGEIQWVWEASTRLDLNQ